MKRLISFIFITSILFTGCTDAEYALQTSYGNKFKITLYSGGQIVREWTSTGKVFSEEASDGYFFVDEDTNQLVRVTGDLVVEKID